MPVERYFLEEPLTLNSKKTLKETEFHHLAHVLRTREGETVEIVNGQGVLAYATVESIQRDKALLSIDKVEESSNVAPRLILAQAMPKPNRLDFILEKGTELGVSEFWLFPGQLSAKKELYPNQIERAKTMTVAAMKQCGRLFLPSIEIKPALKQWNRPEGTSFFGDVNPEALPFLRTWQQLLEKPAPFIFFVGPESGFTDDEHLLLRKMGAQGVKLHENILRTDTAALMAMSLLSYQTLYC